MNQTSRDQLLTAREVAALLSIGRATLYRLLAAGQAPAPLYLAPKIVRWRRAEIDAWLAQLPRSA